MNYQTGNVPPDQFDVLNKCAECGDTWIGPRRALCTKCGDKLGCSNHDCKSSRQCWRFLRGIGDGGFEPFLHEDRCDWFKEMK